MNEIWGWGPFAALAWHAARDRQQHTPPEAIPARRRAWGVRRLLRAFLRALNQVRVPSAAGEGLPSRRPYGDAVGAGGRATARPYDGRGWLTRRCPG